MQHTEARHEHSECTGAVSHRCFASGRQDVSDLESVVTSECVASPARAVAPGPGQAESCGAPRSQHDPSSLLSLRLKNDAGTNQCYANSSIFALFWSVLQHGGRTATPLQALIRRLVQTRREQLVTLRRLSEWEIIGRDSRGLLNNTTSPSSLDTSACACRGCLIFVCGWCKV